MHRGFAVLGPKQPWEQTGRGKVSLAKTRESLTHMAKTIRITGFFFT